MYSRVLSLLSFSLLLNACLDGEIIGEEVAGESGAGTSSGSNTVSSHSGGSTARATSAPLGGAPHSTGSSSEITGGTVGNGGAASTGAGGEGGTQTNSNSSTVRNCLGSGKVELTTRSVMWGGPAALLTGTKDPAIEGVWCNGTDETIFLPGCQLFSTEYLGENGEWQNRGGLVECAWEGTVHELSPGETAEQTGTPSSFGAPTTAQWRLRGNYYLGCTPNQTLMKAACTQQFELQSNEFEYTFE